MLQFYLTAIIFVVKFFLVTTKSSLFFSYWQFSFSSKYFKVWKICFKNCHNIFRI